MDKLTMAHQYAMKHLENSKGNITITSLTAFAWQYADAMQAEVDERRKKHYDFVPAIMEGIKNAELDEWQPDWSKAPKGFNRFVVGSAGGHGFFTNMEPQLQDDFWFVGADGVVVKDHGYQGHWKDSLRKRP